MFGINLIRSLISRLRTARPIAQSDLGPFTSRDRKSSGEVTAQVAAEQFSSTPSDSPVTVSSTNNDTQNGDSPDAGIGPVPLNVAVPLRNPALMKTVRALVTSAENLTTLMTLRGNRLPNDMSHILILMGCDPGFVEALQKLDQIVARNNADLVAVLVIALTNHTNFREKVILMDMIVSQGREARGRFISEYLAPALEGRSTFFDNDRRFCVELLDSIGEPEAESFLWEINYNEVNKVDIFAKSLSEMSNQELVLGTLVSKYIELTAQENKTSDQSQSQQKIEQLILAILKKLEEAKKSVPSAPLKLFYNATTDQWTKGQVAKSLISQLGANAEEVFMEQIQSESNVDDYAARRKRYYAIMHYAESFKEKAAFKLKEFILTCDDPFLVGLTCYKLATCCGEEGREALTSAIHERVSKGEDSIPLAFVSSMTDTHRELPGIIARVFSMSYPPGKGLKEAYLKSVDIPLCKITRYSEGTFHFHSAETELKPNLSLDLVRSIGLHAFAEMAFPYGISEGVNENIVSNVKDLFECAQTINKRAVNNLILGALANTKKDAKTYRLALYLGDMGQRGARYF